MFKKNIGQIIVACVTFMITRFWGCPIKRIINIECPTCGMTRAVIALLNGDIQKYCYTNIMALPLVVVLFINLFFKQNRVMNPITISVSIINLYYYLYRGCVEEMLSTTSNHINYLYILIIIIIYYAIGLAILFAVKSQDKNFIVMNRKLI